MPRNDIAAAAAIIVLLTAGCSGTGTGKGDKLADLRGTGGGSTEPFFPKRPWTVSYQWDCNKQLAQGRNVAQTARVQVSHADDGSAVEKDSLIERSGKSGNGQLTYPRAGAYVVAMSTECDYKVRVTQRAKSATGPAS